MTIPNVVVLSNGTPISSATGTLTGAMIGLNEEERVSSGGVAGDTTITSGGFVFISSGGVADATRVHSGGAENVSAGGYASGAIVDGLYQSAADGLGGCIFVAGANAVASATVLSTGGQAYVSSGGLIIDTTVSGFGVDVVGSGGTSEDTTVLSCGAEYVSAQGSAISATISSAGYQQVFSGGIAEASIVSSGGYEILSSGGQASASQVLFSGQEYVQRGGSATSTTLSGGYQIVSSGGVAYGTTIDGGVEYVYGTVVSTVLNTGAMQSLEQVYAGGVASGVLANDAGTGEVVYSGGSGVSGVFESGGQDYVSSGGTAISVSLGNNGYQDVFADGVAETTEVTSGGVLIVSAGGLASGATISFGGLEVLSSGGVGSNTLLQNGGGIDITTLTFSSGGSAVINSVGLLTVTEGVSQYSQQLSGSYTGTNLQLSPGAYGGTTVSIACYAGGTRILTENGEVPIERLAVGERVITQQGEARAIRWIGRRDYAAIFAAQNPAIQPVLVRAGALADNVPKRDLYVSPCHAIYLDGALIPADALINGATILRCQVLDSISYFHIELATHDIIVAEGAYCESYIDHDNRGMFQNASDYAALYCNPAPRLSHDCAPRLEHGTLVAAVRARLASRAAGPQATYPPCHHEVSLIRPGRVCAVIPAGVSAVKLMSRSGRAPGDKRTLGALILSARIGGVWLDLSDARLVRGFHSPERQNGHVVRWTNGEAVIEWAPAHAAQTLDIDIGAVIDQEKIGEAA